MRGRSIALIAVLVATVNLAGTASHAQDSSDRERAATRQLGIDGLKLYQAGDYAAALEQFQRAHELVGLTTSGLWTARCLAKLGRLVEAAERYLEVTRMTLPADARPKHVDAQREARQEREELLPRIPKVTLRVLGPNETVVAQLDGKAVPSALLGVSQPVDPGSHHFEAAAGQAQAEERFSVAVGDERDVVLRLHLASGAPLTGSPPPKGGSAPPPPPTDHDGAGADGGSAGPNAQGTIGWIAVGLGGAGVILGAITGGLAADKHSSLSDHCPDGRCAPEWHDDVDAYDTLRPISSVGLIAGGVLLATGLTLVLTAPSDQSQDDQSQDDQSSDDQLSVTVIVTPELIGISGTF